MVVSKDAGPGGKQPKQVRDCDPVNVIVIKITIFRSNTQNASDGRTLERCSIGLNFLVPKFMIGKYLNTRLLCVFYTSVA